MTRAEIKECMAQILRRQGRPAAFEDGASLDEIGFRSLDFAELALRVESAVGRSLEFDVRPLRSVRTVADVLDFLAAVSGAPS